MRKMIFFFFQSFEKELEDDHIVVLLPCITTISFYPHALEL